MYFGCQTDSFSHAPFPVPKTFVNQSVGLLHEVENQEYAEQTQNKNGKKTYNSIKREIFLEKKVKKNGFFRCWSSSQHLNGEICIALNEKAKAELKSE